MCKLYQGMKKNYYGICKKFQVTEVPLSTITFAGKKGIQSRATQKVDYSAV